ncbi:MAG: glycosyltransferase family 2 protein [Candidatus Bathyarchaeia archaeon]
MNQDNMESVEVSVIFPVYNEAEKLESAVEKTISVLREAARSYEIIIAEDGSTDGSDEIASMLAVKYPFLRHIHRDRRLGRGQALKNAFKRSRGEILVYMDVDLSTDLNHLETLLKYIRDGYDFVTGSRMLRGSKVERSFSRMLASKWYNFLVRVLLGSKVRDHQCGFKAFKRKPLLQMLDEVSATHWFWDTEIIVRYFLKRYKIKEFPVKWRSRGGTKVNFIGDSLEMGIQIIKLWWNLKIKGIFRRN